MNDSFIIVRIILCVWAVIGAIFGFRNYGRCISNKASLFLVLISGPLLWVGFMFVMIQWFLEEYLIKFIDYLNQK